MDKGQGLLQTPLSLLEKSSRVTKNLRKAIGDHLSTIPQHHNNDRSWETYFRQNTLLPASQLFTVLGCTDWRILASHEFENLLFVDSDHCVSSKPIPINGRCFIDTEGADIRN